jgi:small subunit ribosomal protein S6
VTTYWGTAVAEALPVEVLVNRAELAVDPAKTQRCLNCLRLSDCGPGGALLGEPEPDGVVACMVLFKPCLPGGTVRKLEQRRFGRSRSRGHCGCYIRWSPGSWLALERSGGPFNMSKDPITYDLVLLLSMKSEDEARAKIVADVEAAITGAGGAVSRNQSWGQRPTTYRINHQTEAEYHLLQFTGPTSLLESLSHSLRIADEVLRFRIIKVLPGTPEAPDSAPPVLAGTAGVGTALDSEAA